jgi:hypothetical protein
MPSPGFEPAIPFLECPQTYALGKVYNGARPDTTQESGQSPDKQVKTSHFDVHVSGYTETDPSGVLSPNNWLLPGLTKLVFWSRRRSQAPAVVRIQFECWCSGHNLPARTRYRCRPCGTEEPESTTTEISSRSVGMHYGRN